MIHSFGIARMRRLALLAGGAIVLAGGIVSQQGCGGGGISSLPSGKATLGQVLRGRQLVISGGCADCHSGGLDDPGSATWLAGYTGPATTPGPGSFQLGPFWVYAANITPDATGLAGVTERQIFNALRFGLDPMATPDVIITGTTPGQGNFPASPQYLAPIMPWTSFRNMSDADLWAIVAYLKHGIKPIANTVVTGTEPPDFWASSVTPAQVGPYPQPAFPAASEQFVP